MIAMQAVRMICLIVTVFVILACGHFIAWEDAIGARVNRSFPIESKSKFSRRMGSLNFESDGGTLLRLIETLSSRQQEERDQARRKLLGLARESANQRQQVIQQLLLDVQRHNELNGEHAILSSTFDYWFQVTRIFAELKATEAIDLMVRCIHCGNELTGSLNLRPAFDALEEMGPLAVPKLSNSLTHNPNVSARMQIALCLGSIGGPEAKRALKRALRTERNKNVVHHIKWGLAIIAGDPSKYQ